MIRKEKNSQKNERKKAMIATLGLAVALLVSSTFAWYDFTQEADNVFKGEVNYRVELDENFDPDAWTNTIGEIIDKQVFAKNTGADPLFVRIRLDEVLNVGGEVLGEETVHLYPDSNPIDDGAVFHDYFQWELGQDVKTLQEWEFAGRPTGSFWLLDHDGWAYWAEKLQGDDTETSYLLNSVGMLDKPEDNYVYHIYARLQAVSEKDLEKWYEGYTEEDSEEEKEPISFEPASESAKALLEKLTGIK